MSSKCLRIEEYVKTQEETEKEFRTIATEIADGFGLPTIKGEVIALENSFRIEFGNVVIDVLYPPYVPRDDIASFAEAIASFPEMFARFGVDMADADEDFNKILLILKILADLFTKRTGADSADINIATSDDSKDVQE